MFRALRWFLVFLTALLFLCVFLCVASLCQGILPGLGLLLGTLWFSTSVSAMAIGAIESVSIENISEAGVRVSLRVEINSWVSLRPGKKEGTQRMRQGTVVQIALKDLIRQGFRDSA